ncbi:MAG: DnaA N-terminal domain-containing protein, partial [Nitrospirota bacterium]
MSIDTVWQEALHFIQGKVPKQVYDTWFTPVHLDRIEDSTAHIGVPNKFFGDWLGTHYGPLLAEAVSAARGGGDVAVSFTVDQKSAKPQDHAVVATAAKNVTQPKPRRGIQLNPKYIFKNFVVGAGNQFAHAACMA